MNKEMEQLDAWMEDLQRSTREYVEAFGELTEEELNWKPQPDIWSIGQVVDHVITLNETYYPKFTEVKEGRMKLPFHAKIGFVPRMFGRLLLSTLTKDRKRKHKTVAPFFPTSSDVPADIMDKYQSHKEAFISFMDAHRDYISPKVIMTSPAEGPLVYSTQVALEGIVMHEQRHFLQAKEVLELMKQVRT